MPFPDNSFDVAYAMEATCYSPTLEQVYAEVARVLKPGGYWGTYEWMMTPKYDDKNPVHNEIRTRIERGDGVCNITNRQNAIDSLKKVGLEPVTDEDLATTTPRNPVPWW
jgi:sterol 24-C-methyltransferase